MAFLEFNSVVKKYGKKKVLNNVSFKVKKGEFLTIVGHSGAGKSTLFKLILGEIKPSSGQVLRNNSPVSEMAEEELLEHRRNTGAIFQDFRLLYSKTVFENIAFAMEALGYDDEQIEADVPYVLELVDLSDKMWCFISELSGGEQQRVAIARAIVNQSALLIADEPTGNLDPVNSYEIVNILKQINEMGQTVILSTHDKSVVEKISGRTITITDGEIVLDDPNGKYIL